MGARRKQSSRSNVPRSKVPATKTSSVLSVPGDLPESWRDRVEKYTQRDAKTATGATGWPYIGTRGGVFHFNDDSFEEMPPMLILGARFENCFYGGKYDPDNPNPPDCFAIAEEEDRLAPPEALGDARQCLQSDPAGESCKECWANAFGTAEGRKGKACKNVRRLALLPADNLTAKALSTVEGAMLRIPVTSVKNYGTYANKVTKGLGRPLFFLRTGIAIEDDEKNQFKVTFEPVDMAETPKGLVPLLIKDAEILDVIESRAKEAETYLDQHPMVGGDANSPKPSRERRALASGARTKSVRKPVRKSARKGASRKAGSRNSKL